MVADDQWYLAGQLTFALAHQQVIQAMRRLRDKDGDFLRRSRVTGCPAQAQGRGERLEIASDARIRPITRIQIELESHEEIALAIVDMLLAVEDIEAAFVPEGADLGNQALLVSALDEDDDRACHILYVGRIWKWYRVGLAAGRRV